MSEYVYKWNIMCYNLNTEKREKGSDSMNVPVILPTYNPKEKILRRGGRAYLRRLREDNHYRRWKPPGMFWDILAAF